MKETYPSLKLGLNLSKKERRQWNEYVHEMHWSLADNLKYALLRNKELFPMAENLKNMVGALPIFDIDGEGCTSCGDHNIWEE